MAEQVSRTYWEITNRRFLGEKHPSGAVVKDTLVPWHEKAMGTGNKSNSYFSGTRQILGKQIKGKVTVEDKSEPQGWFQDGGNKNKYQESVFANVWKIRKDSRYFRLKGSTGLLEVEKQISFK